MKRLASQATTWSPVVLRLTLWITAAVLTEFLSEVKDLTREKAAAMFWLDWVKLAVTCLLPGILAWRIYLDQSLSDHKEKIGEGPGLKTVVVAPVAVPPSNE